MGTMIKLHKKLCIIFYNHYFKNNIELVQCERSICKITLHVLLMNSGLTSFL